MKRFALMLMLAGSVLLRAESWLTFGADAQRTGWAKNETAIAKDNARNLRLQWKLHLDNIAKELTSLSAALVVEDVYTQRGVKDLVIIAGSSDNLYAVDGDTGKVLWQKKFTAEGAPKNPPHWLCHNGLNATPAVVQEGNMRTVYTIASDGKLHALNVVNGEDRFPPTQFVPAYSKNWSLNIVDNVLYTTISQGCNGAKSGVYAMDLKSPERAITVFESAPHGGGVWGRGGAAAASNGVIFAETGDGPYDVKAGKLTDTVLALTPKTLKLANYYTPENRAWISKKDLDMGNMTPAIFPFHKWELVAGAGKEGLIYLLDAKSPGGADHRTPLYRSPLFTNEDVDFAGHGFWGAFATWQDPQGARWLYAPAWGPPHSAAPAFSRTHGPAEHGSIMAFKVEEKDGAPVLMPAWISRDLDVPEPPIVANGIVFALSSGENVKQTNSAGHILMSKDRAVAPAGNATLYAFDAATGEELFSSGKTITEFTHFSGIALSGGRVYVTTYESNVYAFGLKK